MPRRDWLLYAAFGLIFLLGVLAALAVRDYGKPPPWIAENSQAPRAETSQSQGYYEKSAQDAAAWIAAVKEKGQPEVPCAEGGDGAKCGEYHDALDLAAQWSTAESASTMVLWTTAQFVIGVVGLIALGVSLWLTRTSVKAALTAVDLTAQTAERQLRAYVLIKKCRLRLGDDGSVSAVVKFVNTGQIPASKFMVLGTIGTLPTDGHPLRIVPPERPTPDTLSKAPIRPHGGATLMLAMANLVSERDRNLIALGKGVVVVYGRAEYLDGFDKKRTTNFRLVYAGPWGGIRRMLVCTDGNEAD